MFTPPYDWDTIRARSSTGDMALRIVVDSRQPEAIRVAAQAIFPALIHLGMPYALHDRAAGPLSPEVVRGQRAVILAQEGVSQALSPEEQSCLLAGLEAGGGLVSFDPWLPLHAPALAAGLGLGSGALGGSCSLLRTESNDLFVTHTRELGQVLKLIQPVPLLPITIREGGVRVPIVAERGEPAVALGRQGAGRWVHYGLSPRVWLNDCLGHANGLDDVFWRSIVWASRKPFLMKAMPPFVTVRLDDCQGIGSLWWSIQSGLRQEPAHLPESVVRMLYDLVPGWRSVAYGFQYIDVFNKHGIIPEVGLYPDQVSREDRVRLKQYFDAGRAEFSIHAMSEYLDYDHGRVINLLYQKGWHQAQDGSYVIDEHTPEDLGNLFMRADQFWAETGMRPGRVVNSHYTNPGLNSLPFLKARGQDMVMGGYLFGRWYDSHYKDPWSRAPYGTMGLIFDYMPVPEGMPGVAYGDFFCAEAHYYDPYRWASEGQVDDDDIDLAGKTLRAPGREEADLEAAARSIVRQVRIGLDSLFFGCLFAHEQGLATLTAPELDEILSLSDRALRRYDRLFAPYEHIAEYAKCKVDSHIEQADEREAGVVCRLSGRTTLPLQLYLFVDQGEGCRYEFRDVPAFAEGLWLALPVCQR